MPDMQSPMPAAATVPVFLDAVPEDPDYAFGCECADPALQIAQWEQEPANEST
jgi:hypothetical protein